MIRRSGRRRSPMSFARQPTTLWLPSTPDCDRYECRGALCAGLLAYSTAKRAAAFATARLNKSPLASQTVVTAPRAARAAVAMEQVPLP